MKIIIGLGNPGKKYQKTRHNLGFMAVEKYQVSSIKYQEVWGLDKKFKAETYQIAPDVLLVKPQTYMNNSGVAVKKILRYYDIRILNDVWIVHDDLDLPLGKLRIQQGGGAAGHRGVESIIESLGSQEFIRFRVGIGRPAAEIKNQKSKIKSPEDYVLERFSKEEEKMLEKILGQICRAIQIALDEGVEKAMNVFN